MDAGFALASQRNPLWLSRVTPFPVVDFPVSTSPASLHQPNWDAEIVALDACLSPGEAPKYPPVRSGPYLMGKFKSTTM